MRHSVEVLHTEPVDIFAVRDACVYTCDFEPRIADIIPNRDRLLRKVFVTQLASDSRFGHPWESDEETYGKIGLDLNHEFHKDFSHAVCFGKLKGNPIESGARIEELLVDEAKK